MKKLSRKKIGDGNTFEEKEPLKIKVCSLADREEKMSAEDKGKMEEINLQEDDPRLEVREDGGDNRNVSKSNTNEAPLPPSVIFAARAFTDQQKKQSSVDHDHNDNTPKGENERKGSKINRARLSTDRTTKPVPFHISNGAERMDSFEIVTKDDVDAGSVYSLFMEKDFRYHFQHPYFRLFCAYFVTFCNFLIYAEDPVAHSRRECTIPVIGNDFSFVCMKWPPNAWSLMKFILWVSGTIVGVIIGKIVFHTIVFNRLLRLKMFSDDKGSWMTMFLSTMLFVFIFSYVYNGFLLIGGSSTDDYHISSFMGLTNAIFMKAAATGTWCGDFFTAWMVTDMMLQEKLYPSWARPVRRWWNTGINRIILFWIVVCLSSFVVLFVIATDYINWDSLNRDFLHSNEISRAFLASFILVLDMTIVMQDWDFPHFIGAIDIKLPGLNTAHIRFKIPKLLKKLEYWHVHISGKWFNYGILFIVILLDLNMWKNQIFYNPYDYGQYIDQEGRIHTVRDQYSLDTANASILSFDYRNTTINPLTNETYIKGDSMMNARYRGYSMSLKGLAFVPSLAVYLLFGILVFIYGRRPKPTKENPYAGRLRKRKRKRFNARKKWNSLRMWMSGVVVLTRHRRRDEEESPPKETLERGDEKEVEVGEGAGAAGADSVMTRDEVEVKGKGTEEVKGEVVL